jgi:AraC-like DNA-binding protein
MVPPAGRARPGAVEEERDARLRQLRDRAALGEDVGDALLAHLDRAIAEGAPASHLWRATGTTLWCLTYQMRLADAERALAVMMPRLRAHGLPGCGAFAEMLRGETLIAGGRHADGFAALVSAAAAPDFARMPAEARVRVLGMLAVHCIMADPGDSLSACLQAAAATWPAEAGPLPIDTAVWLLLPKFFQWLWSGPAFQGRLAPLQWPQERRHRVLQELQAGLIAQAGRTEPRTSRTQQWLDAFLRLVQARVDGDVAGVVAALGSPGEAGLTDTDREVAYSVAGTLLDMGQAAVALERLAPVLEGAESVKRWEVRLNLMHLRSALALQAGQGEAAMALYVRYAALAARQMQHVALDVPMMLKSVTQLPGARPRDQPSIRPAYLERALSLLRDQPLAHKLPELAARVGVSDRTLREAFKVHLGMGPKEYSTQTRLQAAHAHLCAGKARVQSVAALAQQFGFSHPGRFVGLYRRQFGCTPRASPRAPGAGPDEPLH